MPMPTKYEKLYQETGAAGAGLTTPKIDVRDFDYVGYRVQLAGGVAGAGLAATMRMYDTDQTTSINAKGGTITAGAGSFSSCWGPGVVTSYLITGAMAAPVGAYMIVGIPALGAGVIPTITVWGRRNHRGPDVASIQD